MTFLNIFMLGLTFLMGCSSMSKYHPNNMDEQSYRQEVRKQVEQVAGQFEGGDFPFYHWAAPIVQEVNIPAHLTNGVMIPEHKELVIIKPGEWTINQGYPIQSQKRKSYDKQTYNNSDRGSSNLTILPQGVSRFE